MNLDDQDPFHSSNTAKADALGIPILEEIVVVDDEEIANSSTANTNKIIEQLGPEIDQIIEQILTRKIRDAVEEAIATSRAPLQESLLRLLTPIIQK